jgi:hypothetical protein
MGHLVRYFQIWRFRSDISKDGYFIYLTQVIKTCGVLGCGGFSVRPVGVGGPVFDRRGLSGVPVSTALARWLRVPALCKPEGVAGVASAVGMREVPWPEFGDGGNVF